MNADPTINRAWKSMWPARPELRIWEADGYVLSDDGQSWRLEVEVVPEGLDPFYIGQFDTLEEVDEYIGV